MSLRRLRSTDTIRIALVAGQALLLRGDQVRIEVVVDGPHRVELVDIAGTTANDMRGGHARWDVTVALRGGATLTWHGLPFVVAHGADVSRRTSVACEPGCRVALRETLVLGRTAQEGGTLRSALRVSVGALPTLVEDLDLSPRGRRGPAVLGSLRCLDSVTVVGTRLPAAPGVLQAEGPASVARWLGDDLHLSDLDARWREAVALLGRPPTPVGPSPSVRSSTRGEAGRASAPADAVG